MSAILPWLLIAARAAAALALAVALATHALADGLVFWLFVIAFVSDYFDGVVARALNVVTRPLRQTDSLVDTVFYVVLAGATWTLHPEPLRRHAIALGICLGTLVAWSLLDLIRWRAVAGFHSWSAKLFAGALGRWAIVQYGLGGGGRWLVVALRRRNALRSRGDRHQPGPASPRRRPPHGRARAASSRLSRWRSVSAVSGAVGRGPPVMCRRLS